MVDHRPAVRRREGAFLATVGAEPDEAVGNGEVLIERDLNGPTPVLTDRADVARAEMPHGLDHDVARRRIGRGEGVRRPLWLDDRVDGAGDPQRRPVGKRQHAVARDAGREQTNTTRKQKSYSYLLTQISTNWIKRKIKKMQFYIWPNPIAGRYNF